MKPFVFKLQAALDLKLREEDIFKEKLQKATVKYRENLAVLSRLQERVTEIYDIIRDRQSEGIDVQEIRSCTQYISVLNHRINLQEQVTEESRVKMEQVRAELIEVVRNRKVMDKLKAKHYKEYLYECLRQEQKEIDEMAMAGYIYKDSAV